MRNHFRLWPLLSLRKADSAMALSSFPFEISRILAIDFPSSAEKDVALSYTLELCKEQRRYLKSSNLLSPETDKDLTSATLAVARSLRTLRENNPGPPSPEPEILSNALSCLKSEYRARQTEDMPDAHLTAIMIRLSRDIRVRQKSPPPEKPPEPGFWQALRSSIASKLPGITLPRALTAAKIAGITALGINMTSSTLPDFDHVSNASRSGAHTHAKNPLEDPANQPWRSIRKDFPKSEVAQLSNSGRKKASPTEPRERRASTVSRPRRVESPWNPQELFKNRALLAAALDKLEKAPFKDAFKAAVLVESGGRQFDKDGNVIRSIKGATGKAQVMPDTAKGIAVRCTGSEIDWNRFENDGNYNQQLGECYYRMRRKEYGGSNILGGLAYNGGTKRVQDHIARVGDPTKGEVSMVTFIQTLPIKETRLYVLHMLKKAKLVEPEILAAPPASAPEASPSFSQAASATEVPPSSEAETALTAEPASIPEVTEPAAAQHFEMK